MAIFKLKEGSLTDEQVKALESLKEQGVLTLTDLDNEIIQREVDYYVDNETNLKNGEEVKAKFVELMQAEYENITDNEYISRLWEQAKESV